MSTLEAFANGYSTTLSAAVTSTTATSLSVATAPPSWLGYSNMQWRLLVDSELLIVTAVSGTTLTVTRGAEGTTAATHSSGAVATHILSAGGFYRGVSDPFICQARLSLSSTLPIPTTDQTGVTTIYLLPYKGNRIALYDGSSVWYNYPIDLGGSAPSASLSGSSGQLQDVFASYATASGTIVLSFVTWTNVTTRATSLSLQDGVYVLSTDSTKRYLGTIYLSGTNAATDSAVLRGVWNYYNRVARVFKYAFSTVSWAPSTTLTWQQPQNGTTLLSENCYVEAVIGITEEPISLVVSLVVLNNASSTGAVGIGLDSTSVNSADTKGVSGSGASRLAVSSTYKGPPGIGHHTFYCLDWPETNSTYPVFYGNSSVFVSSMSGEIFG